MCFWSPVCCAAGTGERQKEQLVVVLQGPADTRELYSRHWLCENRRPQSLLAPDLLTFSLQIPQPTGDWHNSGGYKHTFVHELSIFCGTWKFVDTIEFVHNYDPKHLIFRQVLKVDKQSSIKQMKILGHFFIEGSDPILHICELHKYVNLCFQYLLWPPLCSDNC